MNNLRPTATLAAVISLLLFGAGYLGLDLSPVVATAIVILPAAVVSYFNPRWAKHRGIFMEHPAAITGSAATLLVWLGTLLGVEVSTDAAIAIVGGLTALVGVVTPRKS